MDSKKPIKFICSVKLCLLIFFLMVLPLSGKVWAASDSSKVAYDSIPYFFKDNFSGFHLIDTSLNELQRYNSLFKTGNFYNITGHLSLPSRNVFYQTRISDALTFCSTLYDNLYLNNNQTEFMHTYYPVTMIKAVVGSKKEQVVELLHSQQILPALNVGFKINGLRTEGYYNKQQANTIGFQTFASYLSPQKRFQSFFAYTYNRIASQLNGGLQPDSAFSYNYSNLSDKNLIPVYLNHAQQLIFGSDVYTKQVLGLDKKLVNHVLSPFNGTSVSLNKIAVYARYQEYFRHYDDQYSDSLYYQNYWITQQPFKDKLRAQKTKIVLSLFNTVADSPLEHYLGYDWQVGFENLDVSFKDYRKNYFTFYTAASLSKNIRNVVLGAEGKYYLNGYNANNYQTVFKLSSAPKKVTHWDIQIGINSAAPEVIYNYYYSNNFYWNNTLKPVQHQFINASLTRQSLGTLFLQYSIIKNYTFADTFALPTQLNVPLNLIQLRYFKVFKWKALRWAPEILIQHENTTQQYLGIPTYFTKASLYFEERIFKRQLWFQTGADIFWLNNYKPYTYMAATHLFYYQNKFTTGNMPLVDIFLSFKIKTVQSFIRLEQINTIFTQPYFYSPYYAMPGLTFKFGLNWMFIN